MNKQKPYTNNSKLSY